MIFVTKYLETRPQMHFVVAQSMILFYQSDPEYYECLPLVYPPYVWLEN